MCATQIQPGLPLPYVPKHELVSVNRETMLHAILKRSARGGVPLRNEFVQRQRADEFGTRGGPLSVLVRNRDSAALDTYLLVHAVASAEPWVCQYPVSSWALALGFENTASPDSARARFSKTIRRLADMRLLEIYESGWRPKIVLTREDGSGRSYFRPRSASDGPWFSVPYAYWTRLYVDRLGFPAKAMLLIAMSSKEGFALPFDRVPAWYGISAKSAERGMRELLKLGLISYDAEYRVEPASPVGVAEVRKYSLERDFSLAARRVAMKRPPRLIVRA